MFENYNGKVLAEKYRIDAEMRDADRSGSDGGSSVGRLYHATHLLMEKPVAVKVLPAALAVDENIARRFSGEAKTLSRISHPNILNVTDYGADKSGAAFIVFENADGATLKETVRQEGKFSLERANRITRQIAAALSVAHSNDVLHRSLTSENIILTKTANDADAVKVLNFAAADETDAFGEISATDAEYLSPEQCAQTADTDARSDVYSLGVILYEMLAGEVPFAAEKSSDVMLKHVQEPPLPLSAFRDDLPNEVETIVLTALAKNPAARYQTANDLAAALNRTAITVVNPAEKLAYPTLSQPVMTAAPEENGQNNIWKTAFIVMAGIAVLSGFFIYMTQVQQTNPPTQLATDANGQPVQPVNPATGTSEQSLSNMGAFSPEMMGNSTLPGGGMPQQVMPGGDGYDAWSRGAPPPGGPPQGYGAPMYVPPPSGPLYDGSVNPGSQFMPNDGNIYVIVPKNANSNVNTQPTKKNPAANTNVQTAPPATPKPTPPAANTAAPTETKPAVKPTPKPTVAPKNNTTQKTTQSGKELDT